MKEIVRLRKPGGAYEPKPYYGHGINESLRLKLLLKVGAGTHVFIIIEDGVLHDQYGQWLDVLENSRNFLTKTGTIRIYELGAYVKGRAAVHAEFQTRT